MKDFSPFQIAVMTGCIVAAVIGVLMFALLRSAGPGSAVGEVTIWGTPSQQVVQPIIDSFRQTDSAFQQVTYQEISPDTYLSVLVNALASGNAPDLVLLSQKDMYAFSDKLQVIPYSTVSQSDFVNTFVDEGQLFLTSQGSLALPLVVDPLMQYWNRDSLAQAAVAQPPKLWNEFIDLAVRLTKADQAGTISKSAVALGGWQNIPNAKAILSALVMQAGDSITTFGSNGLQPTFGQNFAQSVSNPVESALRFYTDFANPSKSVYSWNRSLPSAQDAFVAGDLAIYFGFASENRMIATRNPNLHFGVSALPQAQGGRVLTYGNIIGLAIPRGAKNPNGALTIAEKLTSTAAVTQFSSALNLSPARRDLIGPVPNDATQTTVLQSALIARGFLDPNPAASESIFKTMVESVLSGQNTPADATQNASQAFQRLFPQ
jgi:multiple sugar transport system substrate-binding protein